MNNNKVNTDPDNFEEAYFVLKDKNVDERRNVVI